MSTVRRWSGSRTLSGAALMALSSVAAAAQRPMARASTAGGVQLMVRPRVGDTLLLQVEQTVEVSGRHVDGVSSSPLPVGQGQRRPAQTPVYGPQKYRADTRVTTVQLFAHSVVETGDVASTTLVATTDSLRLWVGNAGDAPRPTRVPVDASSRHVRVRVTPDGAMRVSDQPTPRPLDATLASIPGLLPAGPVRVGDEWQRTMQLPGLPLGAYRADGVVQARLRLDSLSMGGRHAWISVVGVLRRDGAVRELPAGTRVITAGTMRATMIVDRTRAWITDARTVMDVQSEVAPGPAGGGKPMLLDIRLVQQIRVH
ncbi:MAG: hypothetical protein ACOVSI_10515 [Gemmatimonas sp.]